MVENKNTKMFSNGLTESYKVYW